MIEQEYTIVIPGRFDGTILRKYSIELKSIGFNGGVQNRDGDLIYVGREGKILIHPASRTGEETTIKYFDENLEDTVRKIVEIVGGRT